MKLFVLIATLTFLACPCLFAANNSCSQPESDILALVQGDYKSGLDTMTDVDSAKLNDLKAQLVCGEITKEAYCSSVTPIATNLITLMTAQYKHGVETLSVTVEAQKDALDAQMYCI